MRTRYCKPADARVAHQSPDAVAFADAQSVIEKLRQDHLELISLVGACAGARNAEHEKAAVSALCLKIRVHYTLETGVFIAALVDTAGGQSLLDHGAYDYAEMIGFINELQPNRLPQQLAPDLVRLSLQVRNHVHGAERSGGLFDIAMDADVDWPALEVALRTREAALSVLFRSGHISRWSLEGSHDKQSCRRMAYS